jgi:ATP-dependent DNA ligase
MFPITGPNQKFFIWLISLVRRCVRRVKKNFQTLYAAKVRNGFVPRVEREVFERLRELETDICPFANLPEKKRTQWALSKEEMKNRRWLHSELVAQIEFAEWTPDGHLSIPVSWA